MYTYYYGDVYYVDFGAPVGSEQGGVRPAVVVSNNIGNQFSPILIVVPLTTSEKGYLPTHVSMNIGLVPNTALCEQIRTISKLRVKGHRIAHFPENIMNEIDAAINVAKDKNLKIY